MAWQLGREFSSMGTDFIQEASAIVEKLSALDVRRVVFGAARHAYQFNPPLSMKRVEKFERDHKVSLPRPYRRFITELGNGGAGPYYGIMPLPLKAPHLLMPFPYTKPIELSDDDAITAAIPGAVQIAEYGCAINIILVVRGKARGQVWWDARYESGLAPVAAPKSEPMTFDAWWLGLMRHHLGLFERILGMMNAGTKHAKIHKALEPGVLQLEIDEIILSLMDQDPNKKPRKFANKPWGQQCGLVEEHYGKWICGRADRAT
jgi:hypothetical protein